MTVATDALIDKDVIATISYGEQGWEGTVEMQESSTTESAVVEQVAVEQEVVNEQVSEEVVQADQSSALLVSPGEEAQLEKSAEVEESSVENVITNGIHVSNELKKSVRL